jgi:hypothetical protein
MTIEEYYAQWTKDKLYCGEEESWAIDFAIDWQKYNQLNKVKMYTEIQMDEAYDKGCEYGYEARSSPTLFYKKNN